MHWQSIWPVLLALFFFGLIIMTHEQGHFLFAKLFKVKVNEFSVGMGPTLFKKQKGETKYSVRLLPIGGYVAMEGEDEDTGDERALVNQSFWKKFVILSAGSFMNFVTGVVILLAIYAGATAFYTDQIVALAPEFTQTGETGLMPGDRIYKVNG